MRADEVVLAGTTAATLGAVAGLELASNGPVAIASGLALVLALPGLALMTALFPYGPPSWLHRAVWAVGGSIGIVVLSGLVLHVAGEIDRRAWQLILAEISLAAIAVACGRRLFARRLPATPRDVRRAAPATAGSTAAFAVAVLVAVASSALAIGVARLSADGAPSDPFSELWLVRGGGSADAVSATLGVRSAEERIQTFRVALTREDGASRSWTIRLRPGDRWQRVVPVATDGRTVATLVNLDRPGERHREVFLQPPADNGA